MITHRSCCFREEGTPRQVILRRVGPRYRPPPAPLRIRPGTRPHRSGARILSTPRHAFGIPRCPCRRRSHQERICSPCMPASRAPICQKVKKLVSGHRQLCGWPPGPPDHLELPRMAGRVFREEVGSHLWWTLLAGNDDPLGDGSPGWGGCPAGQGVFEVRRRCGCRPPTRLPGRRARAPVEASTGRGG